MGDLNLVGSYFEISRRELEYMNQPSKFLYQCFRQFIDQFPPKTSDDNLILMWKSDLDKMVKNGIQSNRTT